MADASRRRSENTAGTFYVDGTCIDCDTCRWMAPEVYTRVGSQSAVTAQPADEAGTQRAFQALLACPTGSIGTEGKPAVPVLLKDVLRTFPIPVTETVSHNGFHHESSFGATTYFIRRPEGNVLVDSPRFAGPLVKELEAQGGVATLFLTHKDDVGDHEKFHAHFGCERILHEADATGELRGMERLLEGDEPVQLADDLLVIPVPGHTRGSCCLLYTGEASPILFSGDHVAWSGSLEQVYAFRQACWYDWDVQIGAMERLLTHDFEWILPGHGRRCHFDVDAMRSEMERCVTWMRNA